MTRTKLIAIVILLTLGGVIWRHEDALLQFWWDAFARSSYDREKIELNALRIATSPLIFAERPAPKKREQAELGRALFFDTRFSANGQIACASCHQPAKSFTDGEEVADGIAITTKNAPTIINSFANTWFFWDGRADSLASQALGPVENPKEHGIDRGRVAQLLWQNHRAAYEKIYGPFPARLATMLQEKASEEFHAIPAAPRLELAVEQSAYIVATIDTSRIQRQLITQAFAAHEAPQRRLARQAMEAEPGNLEWINQYNSMTPEAQAELNQVFARFGEALAAYENGIVAIDSPFDRFAARLKETKTIEDAFTDGFGPPELHGLSIFLNKGCTNCHSGPNFTDQQFHNIGLPQRGDALELGRARGVLFAAHSPFNCHGGILPETHQESCLELAYINTKNFEYVGAQKTPTLRNVAETAPYMHDGRFKDLDEVMRHYNLLTTDPAVGHREESLQPLYLGKKDLEALKAFMRSLTSPIRDLNE